MQPLSSANIANILALIDCDHSAHQIASITGFHASTITCVWSKHHAHIPKSSSGHPSKLSPTNICHAVHLINTGKADNATRVTQSLQSITNQSLSTQTICHHLKRAGLKAVVKKKCPLLSQCHQCERFDFALSHRHWTVDDWMWVVWSDEVKINRLGSDG